MLHRLWNQLRLIHRQMYYLHLNLSPIIPIFATRYWINILIYIENVVVKISIIMGLLMRHHAGTISAHYANQVMMMKKQKVGIKQDLTLLNVNSVKLRQLHSLIALQQSGNFNLFFSNEQVYMRKRDLNCLQTYKKEND